MKRLLLAVALIALGLAAVAPKAEAADVSIDFFYNNLSSGGSWIEAGDYGYCWQPAVAVSNSSWRPYSDGYWAYTDVGWTWVSYEDFGWATYHYGRWARLHDRGWVWVPGTEWGPAWVSWRTGSDYVGWAPIPPRYGRGASEVVYEGRPIGSRVDIDFDIGPAYYNFVNVRYFGDPVLRERLYEPSQNVTYIGETVNVTNITYNNSMVYNYGPNYNTLSAYSARPIQRLALERQTNVDYNTIAQSGLVTKVQGDRLIVAAPMRVDRPAQAIAPKVVAAKIAQPQPETGWAGITDPNTRAKLQQKMKTENPKAVPPPQATPSNPAALNGGNAPAGAMPTPVAPPPNAKGPEHGKNKHDATNPAATAPAVDAVTPGAPAVATPAGPGKGKGNGKHGNQPAGAPSVAPAPGNTAAPAPPVTPAIAPEKGKGAGKNKHNATPPETAPQSDAAAVGAPSSAAIPPASAAPAGASAKGKGKHDRGGAPAARAPEQAAREMPVVAPQRNAPNGEAAPHGKGAGKKAERFNAPPPPAQAAPQPQAIRPQQPPKHQAPPPQAAPQQMAPVRQPGPPPGPQKGGGKPDKGGKKKGDEGQQPER